jgi:hypothetical protein
MRDPVLMQDVALFLFLLLVSHILLGHFEEHRPKWRRVLKVIFAVALFAGLWIAIGRVWTWAFFVTFVAIGIPIVHMWWLPKHGVNGWTGEPRERYLELVRARDRSRAP